MSLVRKVCVVTGATSGIGRAASLALAGAGAHVEMIGRNGRRGAAVVDKIQRSRTTGSARFQAVELASRRDVEHAAGEIARAFPVIDVLVNNAGARNDHYAASSDGLEMTFAANHLGHFLLTCQLLDRLIAAPQGRVITVSSDSHFGANSVENWLLPEGSYDRRQAYAQSKLANVMFAYRLADRTRTTRVTSNAINPGMVATRFSSNNGIVPWAKHVISHGVRGELISSATAAKSLVRLATSPELATVTGRYFRGDVEARSSSASYDVEASDRLWSLSIELAGLNASNCRAWDIVRP